MGVTRIIRNTKDPITNINYLWYHNSKVYNCITWWWWFTESKCAITIASGKYLTWQEPNIIHDEYHTTPKSWSPIFIVWLIHVPLNHRYLSQIQKNKLIQLVSTYNEWVFTRPDHFCGHLLRYRTYCTPLQLNISQESQAVNKLVSMKKVGDKY